ncbi:hypothetical protein RRF57_006018 [Xylaria bambusicola]|uniref:Uncharacterized protein n=1 Tax=Xylaria bambusicola TaxID=326684 RepID=A0AAN7UPN9_9PEZI
MPSPPGADTSRREHRLVASMRMASGFKSPKNVDGWSSLRFSPFWGAGDTERVSASAGVGVGTGV